MWEVILAAILAAVLLVLPALSWLADQKPRFVYCWMPYCDDDGRWHKYKWVPWLSHLTDRVSPERHIWVLQWWGFLLNVHHG